MIGSDPQLFSDLFKNNANLSDGTERRRNHNYFMEMTPVEGMYDAMMYVGKSWSPCAAPTIRDDDRKQMDPA